MPVPEHLERLDHIIIKVPITLIIPLLDILRYPIPRLVQIERQQLELGGRRVDEVIALGLELHEPPDVFERLC